MSTNDLPSERPAPDAWRWYSYIHLCGAEGKEWIAKYDQANGWDVAARLDHVIVLCRRNRTDEARHMLAGCFDELLAAERNAPPSVASVMRRWCLSTQAYLCYHDRDYKEAWSRLEQSTVAICDAISQSPFLLGFATGCVELAVHRARLARAQRRWDQMRNQFALARAMVGDTLPLCGLANDSQIYVRHIYQWASSLQPQNDGDRAALEFIGNPQVLARGTEILIRRVEASPHMAVPFE